MYFVCMCIYVYVLFVYIFKMTLDDFYNLE